MRVPVSELQVGDVIDGERRVAKVEKYLGAKFRVTFDYVSGIHKGTRAASVEKGDKLVSVEREAEESITAQMTRLLEASEDEYIFQDTSGIYYRLAKEGRKYVVRPANSYGRQNPDAALLFTYAVRNANSFQNAVALVKKEAAPKPWDAKAAEERAKLLAKLKKQNPPPLPAPEPARKERGVECVRCGRVMLNDREYEETDDGPMCSTCGTEEGRWY